MKVHWGNFTFANKSSLLVNVRKYIFFFKPESMPFFLKLSRIKDAFRHPARYDHLIGVSEEVFED
jgi:hypothetical protein